MADNHEKFDDLISLIEKEIELCGDLLELMEKERHILARMDPEEIDLHLQLKGTVMGKIGECERKREDILSSLSLEKATITQVAKTLEGARGKKMAGLAEQFRLTLDRIYALNRSNALLIEKSIFFVESSLNFLKDFNVMKQQKVSVEA